MAISIGDAVLKMSGDTKDLDKSLSDAERKTKSSTQKMQKGLMIAAAAFAAVGIAGLKMADSARKMNAQLGVTALNLGITTKEMRNLALGTTNVTFPLKEVIGSFDLLARAGVKDTEILKSTATAFDTLGDAVGMSASDVTARMVPAMKTFGLSATEVSNKTDLMTNLVRNSTVSLDNFGSVIGYITPELVTMGLTLDDTVALMAIMESKGMSGEVATRAFRTAITQATKEQIPLQEALGITTEEMDKYRDSLEGIEGMTERYAKKANEQWGIMDKLRHKWSELTLQYGTFLQPLEPILATMTALTPILLIFSSVILPKFTITTMAAAVKMRILAVATKAGAVAQGIFAASVGVSIGMLAALVAGITMLSYGIYSLIKHQTDWNKIVDASIKFNEAAEESQGKVNDAVVEAAKEYIALREAYGQIRPEEEERIQNLRNMIATHEEYQTKLVEWTKAVQEQHKAKLKQWAKERDARGGIIELQEKELDLLRQRAIQNLKQYEWDKRYLRLQEEKQKMMRGESNIYGQLLVDYYEAIKARVAMGSATQAETQWLIQHGKAMMDYIDMAKHQTDATLTKTGAMKEQTEGVKALTEAELGLGSAVNFVASTLSSATDAMKGWTIAYDYITGEKYYHPPKHLTKKAWGSRVERLYPEEQITAYKEAFGEHWERAITHYRPGEKVPVTEAIKRYKAEPGWEIKEPKVEVPYYEQGGIAMRPVLAHIAEKSPEAVIPLNKLEGMMGGGRSVNIFVELDGRTIARAIGQPLVDEIRIRQGLKI